MGDDLYYCVGGPLHGRQFPAANTLTQPSLDNDNMQGKSVVTYTAMVNEVGLTVYRWDDLPVRVDEMAITPTK